MRDRPPWERRRFSDDVDDLDVIAHGASLPKGLTRARASTAPGPSFMERDPVGSLRSRVPAKNAATSFDQRIVNGPSSLVRKLDLTASAVKSAISARRVAAAQAPPRRQPVSAKAIAADRRQQNFSTFPKRIDGTFAQMVPAYLRPGQLRFLSPHVVLPCVQRKTRREVLFARRKAGGHGSRARKRLGPHSKIGC